MPGKALVVVYRDGSAWNGTITYFVVNEESIATMHNYAYFQLDAAPGNLKLNLVRRIGFPFILSMIDAATTKGRVLLEIDAYAGRTYYLKYIHGWGRPATLELVPQEKALKALAGLRMADDVRVPIAEATVTTTSTR